MKIIINKAGTRELLLFLGLFVFSIALTFKAHQGRGIFNWQSEIWADKAGYYIYLPATFFYHFDAGKCPEKIDEKTGYGFIVNKKNNTISTQYYYGESLLVSPFFILAHVFSKIKGEDELGGFSVIFNKFSDVAGVFYLVLGLFFLKKFLRNYFRESLQYFILIATFLGTNLFYYSIDDTLMSHVYSFFTIALFLFAMKEFLSDRTRYRYFLLMAVAFGMMIVIRPTNCLVGFFFFFWDASDRKEIMSRLRLIVLPEYLLPLIGIAFLFFLPQMIFWKLEYGSFIHLKYGENFSNWNHPKFLEVWFSTLNGLVPWSPLILFFIAGIFFMIIKRIRNGIPVLFLFLLVSYMAAAYKYWYYGCGYGHRAFVEFYPVLCIPFGYLSEQLFSRPGKILKIIFSFFILLMIYVNMGMSLFGDKCFFGSTWDWDQYSRQLMRIHLYPEPGRFIFINDFENAALYNYSGVTDAVKYSGTWSAVLDAGREYCCEHPAMIRDFKGKYPIFVTTRLFVKKVNPGPIGALLVCSFEKDSTKYGWQIQPLDPFVRDTVSWFCVFKTFRVPAGLNGDTVIKIYIWNKNRCAFFVDDLRITYK